MCGPATPARSPLLHLQVWLLLSVFYSPAVTPVTTGLLSVAALSSLATTQPMCGKALEAPGVVQPLSELYSILTLAQ